MRSQHVPLLCTGFIFVLLASTYTLFRSTIEKEELQLKLVEKQYRERLVERRATLAALKEQVASLSDPACGEKALIEELGVVPKGMIRVEFQ